MLSAMVFRLTARAACSARFLHSRQEGSGESRRRADSGHPESIRQETRQKQVWQQPFPLLPLHPGNDGASLQDKSE